MNINEEMRGIILRRAMDARGDNKTITELHKRSMILARQVWYDIYTTKQRAALRTLKDVLHPLDTSHVTFTIAGTWYNLQASLSSEYRMVDRECPIPPGWGDAGRASPNTIAEIKAHRKTIDIFTDERDAARRKITQFLKQFRTAKSLLEGWPEGKPFYKDMIIITDRKVSALPMIAAAEVNKAIGL